jgi:predicted signal transduction protein with EAL and GGDEF domain
MSVVAEGVETASVWNQLTELGCDLAQGYFLAKPMPAATAYAWILERSQRGDATFHERLEAEHATHSVDLVKHHVA